MKKTRKSIVWNKLLQAVVLGGLIVLSACAPVTPASTPQALARREAQVQSVEIQILQTTPIQVNAILRGNLTESCAALSEHQIQYEANTFRISLFVVSPSDRGCAQATTPFETTIRLETTNLPAGTYTVVANGVSAVFTLPGGDQATGTINGWVWHDLCANGSVNPGANCVQADGSYRSNGRIENGEPPIPGVKVTLGLGACPSTGLKEITTIATDLSYSFTGLEAGTYCVSIDPQNETNAAILLPGSWTYPSAMDGMIGSTVTLGAGENKFDMNFGWDYQFLPAASEVCTDSAKFVSDVTIPDNTVLAPNTPFTKTWRFKNTGSCTWDSSYLVSYISGTTMSQQPGYWIVQQGQTVAPGQTVEISVGMTSPAENGSYASYWGLKKENGQLMPIQGGANGNSFYVKINVNDGGVTVGNITAASIDIVHEEGSGTVCSAEATYFVHAYLTADGPTTATYEINSTAGQIAAGNFQNSNSNGLSISVSGSMIFEQAGTKTINLRFVGPYPYPDDITVNLSVNGGEWHNTKLSCL